MKENSQRGHVYERVDSSQVELLGQDMSSLEAGGDRPFRPLQAWQRQESHQERAATNSQLGRASEESERVEGSHIERHAHEASSQPWQPQESYEERSNMV